MTIEEYRRHLDRLVLVADCIEGEPLSEMLAASERADALGPIVDPMRWMKGRDRNRHIAAFLRAGVRFREAFREFREAMEEPVEAKP